MARSMNQKKKLSILRSVLLERSDKKHPVTMRQLIEALAAHGISAERKSVYNDLENLRELGMDIKTVRGKYAGYYVESREFDLAELKLLVDAVHSSKIIPEKESLELIGKLSAFASVHDRKALKRAVFVSNRAKTVNEDVYSTIDKIHEAMESDKNISFVYFSWTSDKQKALRRDGKRYRISPWSLVWDDSNYYLVGFDTEKNELRHFRIDKMMKVIISEVQRSGKEEFLKYDIQSYSGSVFGMFGGTPATVTLSCENRLANVILDRFGKDTVIFNDGETFRASVKVIPSPVFFGWIMSFGGEISISSPESVKEDYEKLLNKLLGSFKNS